MWICDYCGEIFDEPIEKECVDFEPYGESFVRRVTYDYFCPECGSEDFDRYYGGMESD